MLNSTWIHFTVATTSSVGDKCVSVVMGDVRLALMANCSVYAVTASSLVSLL